MTHSSRFSLAVPLVLAAACHPVPQGRDHDQASGISTAASPALSAKDESAVRAVAVDWARAAKAGDGGIRQNLTPKRAGAKLLPAYEAKFVSVLKKQPDGSWKIVFDVSNENAPPVKQ